MKKSVARFTALSLSLVMLLGLTACGGEKKPSADVETPPAVETPANDDDLPPRWNIDTEDGGTETPEPTPDLSILNFDFPNAGKQDDGTVNAPKEYVVTLHGGVELTLQDDVETQCVKLAGFGKTVDTPSSISMELDPVDSLLMEIPFSTSLTWADIEAGLRQAYGLREDVTFQIMYDDACPPQTVLPLEPGSICDNYNHQPLLSISLYNPIEEELPFVECQVSSVIIHGINGEVYGDASGSIPAADVYALLGEPAFARVRWDSGNKWAETVSYYWAGDGFYVQYNVDFRNYYYNRTAHYGGPTGLLTYIIDDPLVVETIMGSEAAALLRGE